MGELTAIAPVDTVQVGCAVTVATGVAGVAGCALTVRLVAVLVQPLEFLAVKL